MSSGASLSSRDRGCPQRREANFWMSSWRNLRDEADNHLIELALAGGASHVVTKNVRHVGRMELRFPQLFVMTPEKFIKEHVR